jgi:hypothetical protein
MADHLVATLQHGVSQNEQLPPGNSAAYLALSPDTKSKPFMIF